MKKLENKSPKKNLPEFVKFTGVGMQIVATVGIGIAAGWWLDKKFPNNYSWFTIAFSLIMIVVAMIQVYRNFLK